jgi:hypothetical protein
MEVLAQKLSELQNEALNRKLSAIPLMFQEAQMKESMPLARVAASQTYGSLDRLLKMAKEEAERNEILRRRNEAFMPLQSAGTVMGTPVNYGVKEVTSYQPSTIMQLLSILGPAAGQFMGAKAGASGAAAAAAA